MPVELLDDVVEEMADRCGVYGAEERSEWVSTYKARIRKAVRSERLLYGTRATRSRSTDKHLEPQAALKQYGPAMCDDHSGMAMQASGRAISDDGKFDGKFGRK